MVERTLFRRLEYTALRFALRVMFILIFRYRCAGRRWMPRTGAVLVCCNHQSYLDPPLIGTVFNRRMNYLARKTLFRSGTFSWLIASLDAIPLERDGLGMAGLKESLRRLKRGEQLLIFPEGTRTHDGEVQSMKPGFCVLARRSEVTILPMALDGAYQAWPRRSWLPRPGYVQIVVGEPLSPDQIARLDDAALANEVERRIRRCHDLARSARRLSGGARWD